MQPDADAFLARWHRIVAERDLDALADVLADGVAIGAPPYWTPLAGKPLVHHLLGIIVTTIEGFTYHREWTRGRELALEFRGRVGEHELQGIDLITLDDDSRIAHLDVLIRPMNALEALREIVAPKMMAFLASARSEPGRAIANREE
jgi:hypothetical protein